MSRPIWDWGRSEIHLDQRSRSHQIAFDSRSEDQTNIAFIFVRPVEDPTATAFCMSSLAVGMVFATSNAALAPGAAPPSPFFQFFYVAVFLRFSRIMYKKKQKTFPPTEANRSLRRKTFCDVTKYKTKKAELCADGVNKEEQLSCKLRKTLFYVFKRYLALFCN